MPKNTSRFGKLPPQYNFFLNPYKDQRFTRCPKCGAKMGQKKTPLVIHVDPHHPVSLNYSCRYCAHCDLLIAHQDEIEHLLASLFTQVAPEVIGNEYLVLGTFDRSYWKEGTKTSHPAQDLFANLHDFKQVLKFELGYGWESDKASSKLRHPVPKPAPDAPLSRSQRDMPIEDVEDALALVATMKAHLPIPVRATEALMRMLRKQGMNLKRGQRLHIREVFYMGDEGGITCDITPSDQSQQVMLCSLTHLEVVGDRPLAKEMRAYQKRRATKLAKEQATSFGFKIKPRARRRG